jgi:hypothetical protein
VRHRLQPARSGSGDDGAEQQGAAAGEAGEQYVELGPRDDDVLPDSLTDALEDASRATVEALERGVDRCVVGANPPQRAAVRPVPRSAC